jgi:hypothetical protein
MRLRSMRSSVKILKLSAALCLVHSSPTLLFCSDDNSTISLRPAVGRMSCSGPNFPSWTATCNISLCLVSRSLRGALASRSLLATLPRTTDHVCPSCFLGWIDKVVAFIEKVHTKVEDAATDVLQRQLWRAPPRSGHEEGAPLQARSQFLLPPSSRLLIPPSAHHCVCVPGRCKSKS